MKDPSAQSHQTFSESEMVDWCNKVRLAAYVEIAGMLIDVGMEHAAQAVIAFRAGIENGEIAESWEKSH